MTKARSPASVAARSMSEHYSSVSTANNNHYVPNRSYRMRTIAKGELTAHRRELKKVYMRDRRETENNKYVERFMKCHSDWRKIFVFLRDDNKRLKPISREDYDPIKKNIDRYTYYDGCNGGSGRTRHTTSSNTYSMRRNPGRMARIRTKQNGKCKCKNYRCNSNCKNARAFEICNEYNCINHGRCENNWCNPKNQHLHTCVPKRQGEIEGKGLFTFSPIPHGSVVGQYLGEVKKWNPKTKPPSSYCVQMKHNNKFYLIDAKAKGNNTRYLNHSCNPNCVLDQRTVDGMETMWVRTLRYISAREFLTINYSNDASGFFPVCKCGAENCRHRSG